MNAIVGYAKNGTLSQIDKCVNVMSRHSLAQLADTFKDNKVELALAGLNTQNSVYNAIDCRGWWGIISTLPYVGNVTI